jgi:hypothetical protein
MPKHEARWLLIKYMTYCLFLAYLGAAYFSIGYCIPARSDRLPVLLQLDKRVPFIPITVWPYLGLLAWVFIITPVVLRRRKTLYQLITAAIISAAFNFFVFIVMPLNYPRPIITASGAILNAWGSPVIDFPWDPVSKQFVHLMYYIDPASCTFPALHVTYPTLFALALYQESKFWGKHLAVCAAVLLVTTWTTKQHFILDGLVGALTACIGYAVALRTWTLRTS